LQLILFFGALDPSVTVAVLAAALGPLGAYFVAARRLSGKIANSDAEQLWEESRAIRDWSRERLDVCESEIRDLRSALSKMSNRFAVMESENTMLREELNHSKDRIRILEERHGQKGI
jgi:TolA-binding protein